VSTKIAPARAAGKSSAASDGERPHPPPTESSHPPQPPPQPTAQDVTEWLKILIDPGQVAELRIPKPTKPGEKPSAIVRHFEFGQLGAMAREALRHSGKFPAVYSAINPVDPALFKGRKSASDRDITHRRRLLIDADPVRDPAAEATERRAAEAEGRDFSGISATDAEKAAALATAAAARDFLTERGFPAPVDADSGNGGHLNYAIDLPNDEPSKELIQQFLKALAARFDTDAAKIDTSVYNASRVAKLYGTMACKGRPTAERPHRVSRVLMVPTAFTPVPRELLEAIASEAPGNDQGMPPADKTKSAASRNGHRERTRGGGETTISPAVRLRRARAYLKACEPAISGTKGHNKTFKVACNTGPGFDLDPEAFLSLLMEDGGYNVRCQPRWTEAELRHKVTHAYDRTTDRGWLLRESRSNGHGNGKARAGRRDDGPPPTALGRGDGPGGELPTIRITTEEFRIIDQAVAALGIDPNVHQRGNALVTILRDPTPKNRAILRPPGSPRIASLPLPRLRELLTRRAKWEKFNKKDGAYEPAHPPDWAVAGIAHRGTWPEIRPIEALTEAPVLRLDGTILDTPGYDERTCLLYEPNADFPKVPVRATRCDASDAAAALLRLVIDFPFAGDEHRAAWLASLLTPLARFAIAGACPLFLFDANTPGTGKSKLADIAAIITTGRTIARTTYPDTDDELRKRITSIALAGDRMVLLDNIATKFGGSALDSALTGMTWRDRFLGRMEMTAELPLFTVWYATGNNVSLKGDIIRRIVPCRLASRVERPEERTDFEIQGDLLEYVARERPRLVAAALTILRAHAAAGWPDGGLTPLGSFDQWSRVVRSAVHWATGLDPCLTRETIRASDLDEQARIAAIEGWLELRDGGLDLTAAEALGQVKADPERFHRLREAFMGWSRDDELPSAKTIGKRIGAFEGRVLNDKYFASKIDRGTKYWRVESVAKGQAPPIQPRPSDHGEAKA
jgi:hypothetical protein